ncbi:MAG: glycosyltransferase [Gammaproteobacteria bacterium]
MKVSGFTFIRNGRALGYPFLESISSALPICDEFVVAVGESSDDTRQRLQTIDSPKLRILETHWNEQMRVRGYVYAQQKMIAHFNCNGDWAFYLEGDEVLHESELSAIYDSMTRHLPNSQVEALVFDYYHFYGSPEWLAVSPGWYRRAPRIIRNTIRTYCPDGLFFVVMDKNKRGRYPRAALANAAIYHYGHVRALPKMKQKVQQVSRYWNHPPPPFPRYQIDPRALQSFAGQHPRIMSRWLAEDAEWNFRPDPNHVPTQRERRHHYLMRLESWFGLDLSKKHFRLIAG